MTRTTAAPRPSSLAAVALAGCGITDPYTHPRGAQRHDDPARTHATTATSPIPASHRRPTRPRRPRAASPPARHRAGAATPRQALRLYTRLYVNWTATTIGAHQRQLAAISQGTARAAALQAAASYSRDTELKNSHVVEHRGDRVDRRRAGPGARPVGDRHQRAHHRQRRLHRPARRRARHLRPRHPHPPRLGHRPMVTAKLNQRQHLARRRRGGHRRDARRRPGRDPRPHDRGIDAAAPDAHRQPRRLLAILADNVRVLAAPFLLWLLGLPGPASAAAPATPLILARHRGERDPGRDRARPLAEPAHPVHAAAAARMGRADPRRQRLAGRSGPPPRHDSTSPSWPPSLPSLLLAAAALETWCTPHRHCDRASPADRPLTRSRIGPCRVGGRGLPAPRILRRRRPGRCKVARSLPLTPFGSARPKPGADRAPSTTPTPTRRDHHMNSVTLTGSLTADPDCAAPPTDRSPASASRSSGPARTAKTRAPTTSTSPSSDATPRPSPSTSPRAARSPSTAACTTPNGTPTTAAARSSRSSPATSSSSTPARPTTTAPARRRGRSRHPRRLLSARKGLAGRPRQRASRHKPHPPDTEEQP